MNQPKQGSNLQLLAASNYLRSLGIDDETTVRRCIDVLTNPNSLFGGTRAGKKPVNPFARKITVEEMEEVVAFFMNNGFAQLEVARVRRTVVSRQPCAAAPCRRWSVTWHPNVLLHVTMPDLARPFFLQIVKEFPQVLGYPVEARLQPLFAYLAEALQLSPAAVADLLKARPVLLGLQRESVERMVGFLIENGSSQEEILKLLETSL